MFIIKNWGKSGLWYGLQKGDIVLCGIGYGNQYIILNKISDSMNIMYANALRDNDIQSALFGDNSSSASDVIFDDLTAGTFILKSGNSNIKVSQDDGIFVGNLGAGSIYFDIDDRVEHRNNYSSLVSNQLFNITNSGYNLNGVVLRDMTTSATGDDENYNDPRLYKKWYSNLKQIGFDTTTMIALQTKGAIQRNPALIENREIVYEFSDDFYIESDMNEALKQTDVTRNGAKTQINNPLTSRRIRKEDCFSLSLISPNYLIEKIEGTAVDINGHIIDLNRNILPVGDSVLGTTITNPSGFFPLQEIHRRGLAYHFELNARKDRLNPFWGLQPETGSGNNYAVGTYNDPYKRDRSRLFLDIDKEGQFKLNIPCSSEVGNVGILARYENYTNINPFITDSSTNPNYDYFIKSDDANTDILLDTYGMGVVSPAGSDKLIARDRITNNVIKVGTMFHDISKTCIYPVELNADLTSIKSQTDSTNQFRSGILYGPDYYTIDADHTQRNLLRNTAIDSIITKTLIVDRNGSATPNAGGRSGTVVFDGMLNINIGANTADKQSLWLDLQGGCVQRIGCDKNGISNATQTDGDFYLQVGGVPGFENIDGYMVSSKDPDLRFDPSLPGNASIVTPNSNKTNTFELRIIQGNGQYCRILVDNKGVLISSPKNIELRADESIILSAMRDVRINGEDIKHHVDDVSNDLATPISRQTRDITKVYEPDPGGGILFPKPYAGSQTTFG